MLIIDHDDWLIYWSMILYSFKMRQTCLFYKRVLQIRHLQWRCFHKSSSCPEAFNNLESNSWLAWVNDNASEQWNWIRVSHTSLLPSIPVSYYYTITKY